MKFTLTLGIILAYWLMYVFMFDFEVLMIVMLAQILSAIIGIQINLSDTKKE